VFDSAARLKARFTSGEQKNSASRGGRQNVRGISLKNGVIIVIEGSEGKGVSLLRQ
jgi:hypothetical protein